MGPLPNCCVLMWWAPHAGRVPVDRIAVVVNGKWQPLKRTEWNTFEWHGDYGLVADALPIRV